MELGTQTPAIIWTLKRKPITKKSFFVHIIFWLYWKSFVRLKIKSGYPLFFIHNIKYHIFFIISILFLKIELSDIIFVWMPKTYSLNLLPIISLCSPILQSISIINFISWSYTIWPLIEFFLSIEFYLNAKKWKWAPKSWFFMKPIVN